MRLLIASTEVCHAPPTAPIEKRSRMLPSRPTELLTRTSSSVNRERLSASWLNDSMMFAISGSPFGVNRMLKSPAFIDRMPASSPCRDRSRDARCAFAAGVDASASTGTSTSARTAARFFPFLRPRPREPPPASEGTSSSSRSGLLPTPTVSSCRKGVDQNGRVQDGPLREFFHARGRETHVSSTC